VDLGVCVTKEPAASVIGSPGGQPAIKSAGVYL